MQSQCVIKSSHTPLQFQNEPRFHPQPAVVFKKLLSPSVFQCSISPPNLQIIKPRTRSRLLTCCITPAQELVDNTTSVENDNSNSPVSIPTKEEEEEEIVNREGLENQSIWEQMKEIAAFTGPATGLWICGPLMSLIDTAVIGQGSSIELAALGPGTVLCDYMSYIFMFLSIATSNMVATSLAKQDKNEVQHQLSVLLFIGLSSGISMFSVHSFFGSSSTSRWKTLDDFVAKNFVFPFPGFIGSKNLSILPAANTYVQIRGLAWPAVLVGWVAQSASLGMKDSWGPLKALAVATAINGIGDIVLCRFLGYGIAGAAWATMVSQVVAAYMMIDSLNKKGYNGYALSVPSVSDLVAIFALAGPAFIMMMSKVAFYSLLIYVATSMGTVTVAAHQVMVQAFVMCSVWGEPLCQTAQSFMPELMYGVNRNLAKARRLLKSLVIIGAALGFVLGIIGTSVPWLFPKIFTQDQKVIQEMHQVLVPFFIALVGTPCILCFEGTLLAGRDLKFASLSMSGCFSVGALLLLLVSRGGYGLQGCWFTLVAFQWARFFLSLQRLLSPTGILFSEVSSHYEAKKELKAA